MASMHREYVLEVLSDQNFVRDIVKGKFGGRREQFTEVSDISV